MAPHDQELKVKVTGLRVILKAKKRRYGVVRVFGGKGAFLKVQKSPREGHVPGPDFVCEILGRGPAKEGVLQS
jgi:hypothetical protein